MEAAPAPRCGGAASCKLLALAADVAAAEARSPGVPTASMTRCFLCSHSSVVWEYLLGIVG